MLYNISKIFMLNDKYLIQMDLFGIGEINKLKREELLQQSKADIELSALMSVCPATTLRLLLQIRATSRNQQEIITDASFCKQRTLVKNELKRSLDLYTNLNSILSSSTSVETCRKLDALHQSDVI